MQIFCFFFFFRRKNIVWANTTSQFGHILLLSPRYYFFIPPFNFRDTALQWNVEFRSGRDLLYHITPNMLCSQQTIAPSKASDQRVRPAFPSAHPSPSVAAVLWFLGGSAPLWEKARAQRGKTQIALSAATKSKAVQISYLIKLFLFVCLGFFPSFLVP